VVLTAEQEASENTKNKAFYFIFIEQTTNNNKSG